MKRSQVDLDACTIRLDPGAAKNDDGRLVSLTPELVELLQVQEERAQILVMCLGRAIPHRGAARMERLAELAKAVANGEKPGLFKMIRHDFRRTAVGNLVNRGVPDRVAMKITGHNPRAVFDRYRIVSPADLQEAVRKLAGTLSEKSVKEEGVPLGTP